MPATAGGDRQTACAPGFAVLAAEPTHVHEPAESGMAAPEIPVRPFRTDRYLPLLYNALTSASDSARS